VPPPGSELSPSCSSPPRPARPPQGIPANSTRSHSPPALRPRAPRPRAHATLPCHRPCSPMTSRSTLGPPSRGRSLPTPPSRCQRPPPPLRRRLRRARAAAMLVTALLYQFSIRLLAVHLCTRPEILVVGLMCWFVSRLGACAGARTWRGCSLRGELPERRGVVADPSCWREEEEGSASTVCGGCREGDWFYIFTKSRKSGPQLGGEEQIGPSSQPGGGLAKRGAADAPLTGLGSRACNRDGACSKKARRTPLLEANLELYLPLDANKRH
jgi:hypothetical protein